MNLQALAERRARAAAELETLSQVCPRGDREENAAHLQAQALARAAYVSAEQAYQSALSVLTTDEIKAMGLHA